MRNKNWIFVIILIIGFSYSDLFGGFVPPDKPYIREAGKINGATCNELKTLYGIDCPGLGFGMSDEPGVVFTLYIRLEVDHLSDMDHARSLTLNLVDIYLRHIRANREFIDKCAVDPFNEGNINMIVGQRINNPEDGSSFLDAVLFGNGKITYVYRRKEGEITKSQYIKETLAEARQKVTDVDRGIERCQN